MAKTSGRAWHFGSICDAAVRNKCRTSSERLESPPPPPFFLSSFYLLLFFFPVLSLLCNWGLVCGCPHYLFAADDSLLDCCGLVVHLPWGLSVVHRFDFSCQASYFFVEFKGTTTKKKKKKKTIKKERKKEKKKKRKKDRKWPCINESKNKSATTDRQYWYYKHY